MQSHMGFNCTAISSYTSFLYVYKFGVVVGIVFLTMLLGLFGTIDNDFPGLFDYSN